MVPGVVALPIHHRKRFLGSATETTRAAARFYCPPADLQARTWRGIVLSQEYRRPARQPAGSLRQYRARAMVRSTAGDATSCRLIPDTAGGRASRTRGARRAGIEFAPAAPDRDANAVVTARADAGTSVADSQRHSCNQYHGIRAGRNSEEAVVFLRPRASRPPPTISGRDARGPGGWLSRCIHENPLAHARDYGRD